VSLKERIAADRARHEREKGLTEFQRRILHHLRTWPNGSASTWEIAMTTFPEKWTKKTGRARSGRAALIGHIQREARKMGLITWRGEGIHAATYIALGEKWRS